MNQNPKFFMFTCLIVWSGCNAFDNTNAHRHAVKSGASLLPQASEIESLLGETDHFITHFGTAFGAGVRKWNSEVYFGGRYSLTMQADVKVDFSKSIVTEVVGPPKFYLVEYTKIKRNENGNIESHGGGGCEFGPEEWKLFFESHGDFAILGLEKNPKPLNGFDAYVDSIRSPREKIRLNEK